MNSTIDIQFLSHSAALIQRAEQDLAADNARASAEQNKRDWKEFERLVRLHGFCNCLAVMAGVAEDRANESVEGSEAEKDYLMVMEVLEMASQGCDLTYGTYPAGAVTARTKALTNMRNLIGASNE